MNIKISKVVWLVLLFALNTTACNPGNIELETPTPTAEPILTTTPTLVWFPPTTTPSPKPPLPTIAPTSDRRPGLGDIILEDDFSSPGQWTLFRNDAGSAAMGIGELTLAAAKPKVLLSSYYQDALPQNYYLEISTNTSLCRGLDMYGLLLRTDGTQNAYRFIINCSGQVRFDWDKSGTIIPLYDWTPSGQVPPGSPVVLRLGVWAVGNEMRFFIDDFYQFSVQRLTLLNGGMGFFARAAADSPLTVNFSHMQLRQVTPLSTP